MTTVRIPQPGEVWTSKRDAEYQLRVTSLVGHVEAVGEFVGMPGTSGAFSLAYLAEHFTPPAADDLLDRMGEALRVALTPWRTSFSTDPCDFTEDEYEDGWCCVHDQRATLGRPTRCRGGRIADAFAVLREWEPRS